MVNIPYLAIKPISRKSMTLMSFMLLDFLITYFGINTLNFITEANELLAPLFEIPFMFSLSIRLVHMLLIYTMLEYIGDKKFDLYNKILNFGLIINVGILFLHIRWILIYITMKLITGLNYLKGA